MRRGSGLLLRVRGNQGRIQVDKQRGRGRRVVVGGIAPRWRPTPSLGLPPSRRLIAASAAGASAASVAMAREVVRSEPTDP